MLAWDPRIENNEMLTLREAANAARMSFWKFYRIMHGKAPGVPKLSPVRIGRRAMVQKWLREIEGAAAIRTVASAEGE